VEAVVVGKFRFPALPPFAAPIAIYRDHDRSAVHPSHSFALDASPEEAAFLAKPQKKAMPDWGN
jgi:hypothetical protein